MNDKDTEFVELARLRHPPINARAGGSLDALVRSLKEFGQHKPIVARRSDGTIIAGNHLYDAARAAGFDKVWVHWVDDDAVTSVRRAIADNATQDLTHWDYDALRSQLEEVGYDIPGITPNVLRDMDKQWLREVAGVEEEDDIRNNAEMALVARPMEHYDFVVIYCRDEHEWAEAVSVLDLAPKTRAEKNNKGVGVNRVLTWPEFAERVKRWVKATSR